MRLLVLLVFALFVTFAQVLCNRKEAEVVDDEFAEFEEEFEFDSPTKETAPSKEEGKSDDVENDEIVDEIDDQEEDEEEEEDLSIKNVYDSDEFEVISSEQGKQMSSNDHLEISESTVKLLPFWRMYFGELCVGGALLLYVLNYLYGRTRNGMMAQSCSALAVTLGKKEAYFLMAEKSGTARLTNQLGVLKANFTIVGDDGEGDEPNEDRLVKRADHSFVVWASGRTGCDGLLIHFELQKRHDLYAVIASIFRPSPDTVSFIFKLSQLDMEGIVFALAPRKAAAKMHKDYEDLGKYCAPPRPVDRFGLPSSWSMLIETNEAASTILTHQVVTFLAQNSQRFVSIHVTDQYTGLKDDSGEDNETVVVKNPERRIHITFTLPTDIAENTALLQFSIMMLEHFRNIRFSKEVREKTLKNRSKVAQGLEKLQHQQRQEAAQQRREEKKKAEKEKMLSETDPDKTRKWEEKERKKQMKKSQPRMKQMKVRG